MSFRSFLLLLLLATFSEFVAAAAGTLNTLKHTGEDGGASSSSTSTTTTDNKNRKDGAGGGEDASLPPDYLTRDSSVVMITGAAGFIGSELALALYRTYRPRKIICVDSMDSEFGGISPEPIVVEHQKAAAAEQPETTTTTSKAQQQFRTERELALLEFKRQRVFHLLQTLGTTAHFYRVDLRPNIPEFFEAGEVPILHHIFTMHKDITHVVHLADPYHRGTLHEKSQSLWQAVPRLKDQPKAGMVEAIMEELRLIQQQQQLQPDRKVPHFVYASSYEVYNNRQRSAAQSGNVNPPPFAEEKPLTTPSTLAGASKLMDEVLVQSYYETDGIFSVGLRFFSVYGPWGLPGSPLFEMAERTVMGQSPLEVDADTMDDVRDYIYIDDAVDAIMTAMQFRTHQNVPVVFNVGSGTGNTLRSIGQSMLTSIGRDAPQSAADASAKPETVAIASTKRSEVLLGFQARVSLSEGLKQLLAWHYDRAFPYGGGPDQQEDANVKSIKENGVVSCQRYDSECLKGAPVFPCASECSNPNQCMSSFYDDVFVLTRRLTAECPDVFYTIALDEHLVAIPSAQVDVSSLSKSRLEDVGYSKCNIAFVSDTSPLVKRLLTVGVVGGSGEASSGDAAIRNRLMQHGHWTLVPVTLPTASTAGADYAPYLDLLPKLSPGLFFGGNTRRAIYADPTVIFDSIPQVLAEFEKIPPQAAAAGAAAGTAILIGKQSPGDGQASMFGDQRHLSKKKIVQESAYRMIRIAAINEMDTESFTQRVDSSFIVHALGDGSISTRNNDARLFRCDVMAELVQWDVSQDRSAFEFIMGLHDMWSRVIARKNQQQPWWVMGNMQEKPQELKIEEQKQQDTVVEEGEGEANQDEMQAANSGDGIDKDARDMKQQTKKKSSSSSKKVKTTHEETQKEEQAADVAAPGGEETSDTKKDVKEHEKGENVVPPETEPTSTTEQASNVEVPVTGTNEKASEESEGEVKPSKENGNGDNVQTETEETSTTEQASNVEVTAAGTNEKASEESEAEVKPIKQNENGDNIQSETEETSTTEQASNVEVTAGGTNEKASGERGEVKTIKENENGDNVQTETEETSTAKQASNVEVPVAGTNEKASKESEGDVEPMKENKNGGDIVKSETEETSTTEQASNVEVTAAGTNEKAKGEVKPDDEKTLGANTDLKENAEGGDILQAETEDSSTAEQASNAEVKEAGMNEKASGNGEGEVKIDSNKISVEESRRRHRRLQAEEEDEDEEDTEGGPIISGWGEEHSSFGMPESIQDAVRAVFGDAKVAATSNKQHGNADDDASSEDDDAEIQGEGDGEDNGDGATETEDHRTDKDARRHTRQDPDFSDDVWLGVLSSTEKQYFARIVPSSTVGAIHLDVFPMRH